MTYPQYPQNPAAQPQYPPAAPQQAYPPQQGYPPQQQYPQGYPQQAPPPQAPPQAPLPQTGLSDFTSQPGVGGSSLQFPALGHRYRVTVARPLGDGDFPVQTTMPDQFGRSTVKTFNDGRPMVRMAVPVLVPPDAAHPDGQATLNVQGQMAEALKQAMAVAGAGHLKGVPEDHSVIDVGFTSERPPKRQGQNAQKIYTVVYQRPPGAAQADAAVQQAQQAPPAPNGQQAPVQYQQPYNAQAGMQQYAPEMQHPQPAPPVGQQPVPQPQGQIQPTAVPPPPYANQGTVIPGSPVAQGVPQGMAGPAEQVAYATQAAPQVPPPPLGPVAPMAPPPGMSPENAALLAQLTGQQPPQ